MQIRPFFEHGNRSPSSPEKKYGGNGSKTRYEMIGHVYRLRWVKISTEFVPGALRNWQNPTNVF